MASAGINELAAAIPPKPRPLTLDERAQWNAYVDYLDKKGLKGSTQLDNRDTGLGQRLMEEYRAQNPHFTLTYPQVSSVQNDLQDYRNSLIQKWKANPATADGITSPDQIMSGISPVDGWLGSKTSSYKYPVAADPLTGQRGAYGLNTNAYDAAVAAFNVRRKNGN